MTEEAILEKNPIDDEVLAAYNEILFQLKDTKKLTPVDPIQQEKTEMIQALTKQTPDMALNHFDNLRRALMNSIDDIREKYLAEQKKLLDLETAIEHKSTFLKNLHKVEINFDSLAALIQLNKEKAALFEKEMTEKKIQFNQEMLKKQKEWQQEEERYIAERNLNRTKERNQYEADRRLLNQELTAARQKFEKNIAEREARVIEHEKTLQQVKDLEAHIAAFPAERNKIKQETEAEVTKTLTTQFDYEMQLAKKEMNLYEQTIKTLETKIALLESNVSRFESLKESFSKLLNPSDNHFAKSPLES